MSKFPIRPFISTARPADSSPLSVDGEGSGDGGVPQHNGLQPIAARPAAPDPSSSPSLLTERGPGGEVEQPAGEVSPRPEGEGSGGEGLSDSRPFLRVKQWYEFPVRSADAQCKFMVEVYRAAFLWSIWREAQRIRRSLGLPFSEYFSEDD